MDSIDLQLVDDIGALRDLLLELVQILQLFPPMFLCIQQVLVRRLPLVRHQEPVAGQVHLIHFDAELFLAVPPYGIVRHLLLQLALQVALLVDFPI